MNELIIDDSCVGIRFIQPIELYNILQQGIDYPKLSDPNFLLLLDTRGKAAYNESHILTARKSPNIAEGESVIPYDTEIECKVNIVVYDSNTVSESVSEGPAIRCAEYLWNVGSKNLVQVLQGGYELFSALYPFLRTQKAIYMPREVDIIETYPFEIIPRLLYLGNRRQGNRAYVHKDLKIVAVVNCCIAEAEFPIEPDPLNMHHVNVEDDDEADIYSFFHAASNFINWHMARENPVLVYSDKGISRSASIVMAFLIQCRAFSLQAAYHLLSQRNWMLRPNRAFITQLSKWEKVSYSTVITDVAEPYY